MKKAILFFLLILVPFLYGYKVTFIVYVPENTPEDSDIYISGNFNNWNVNDEKFKFKKEENYYVLEADLSGIIKFLITRGSSDTIENRQKYRIMKVSKDGTKITVKVKGWKDLSGSLELIKDFYSPELDNSRNIIVYLPMGYEKDTSKSYPVLYLHDGQNLFDAKTSFIGVEWQVDETLDRMILNKEIEPVIVVGIYNNADRLSEYSPWYDEEYKKGGKGDKYLEFIVNTLKPYIDKKYRTIEDKNYIGGSSMGGLISLYAVSKCPVFSGAIVMSPSLFFGNHEIFNFVEKNPPLNSKIYLYVGGKESDNPMFVEDVIKMKELLESLNVKVKYSFDPDGVHNEAFWAKKFSEAIKWMLEGEN